MKEILQLFESETAARLGRIDAGLAAVDEVVTDPERYETLVRDAHTVKGSSAMMGFPTLTDAAAVLEGALDALAAGRLVLDTALRDCLGAVATELRVLADLAVRGEAQPAGERAAVETLRVIVGEVSR